MIWRGPMVISALTQMLREVDWGDARRPGRRHAAGHRRRAAHHGAAGAARRRVIVSTPQDLALIDARKGLNMFRRVDVPVLGIVENMSYFVCPHCGGRTDIFAHGGARHEAERLGVPFLGEVPLDLDIRLTSDAGTPIVVAEPDGRARPDLPRHRPPGVGRRRARARRGRPGRAADRDRGLGAWRGDQTGVRRHDFTESQDQYTPKRAISRRAPARAADATGRTVERYPEDVEGRSVLAVLLVQWNSSDVRATEFRACPAFWENPLCRHQSR